MLALFTLTAALAVTPEPLPEDPGLSVIHFEADEPQALFARITLTKDGVEKKVTPFCQIEEAGTEVRLDCGIWGWVPVHPVVTADPSVSTYSVRKKKFVPRAGWTLKKIVEPSGVHWEPGWFWWTGECVLDASDASFCDSACGEIGLDYGSNCAAVASQSGGECVAECVSMVGISQGMVIATASRAPIPR